MFHFGIYRHSSELRAWFNCKKKKKKKGQCTHSFRLILRGSCSFEQTSASGDSAESTFRLMMALTPKRLFLYLCISISLLRPYTLFSRSPLVNKTLFESTFSWRVADNDRYAMIHARKPELKNEPTWNNSSVKSYPEIGVKSQRWPAVFPGPLHEGRALGSKWWGPGFEASAVSTTSKNFFDNFRREFSPVANKLFRKLETSSISFTCTSSKWKHEACSFLDSGCYGMFLAIVGGGCMWPSSLYSDSFSSFRGATRSRSWDQC